jgi:O-antigen ligase
VSSWRPVWWGLTIGQIFYLFLIEKSKRLLLISAMLLLQIILFTANIANYGDRVTELVRNIGNEERNIIWKDAWTMQKTSTPSNWLHGHGQNTFVLGFKPFSTYHNKKNLNFTSPHNPVLDVLYSSGILGMLLVIALCYFPYKYCMKIITNNEENQSLACCTLIATTALLISAGLNYAFFRLISFFPLAFVYGVLIYLYQNKIQTHKDSKNYEIKN